MYVCTLSEVEKVRNNKLREQLEKEGQRLCVICQVSMHALINSIHALLG